MSISLMNEYFFISMAYAAPQKEAGGGGAILEKTSDAPETQTEVPGEEKHSEGLSLQPTTIAFQALNFVILLVLLNLILYKPLTKLLADREHKIKKGVEDAEKAKASLAEATSIRQDMMKRAQAESLETLEKARKAGEEVKTGIITEAHKEADHIIKSGHQLVEMDKEKTLAELKGKAVDLIVKTTEKVLQEKIDDNKDAKMIKEHLKAYSA